MNWRSGKARTWTLVAAICVGLLLFFGLAMMLIRWATVLLGLSLYMQGVVVGALGVCLPSWFFGYVFNGGDHEPTPATSPRRRGAEA